MRVYDVKAEFGSSAGLQPGVTFLRATKLVPNRPGAASITFGYTTFPGVIVHVGALRDLAFPICGCDACDTTAEDEAERLEQQVFAVVAGGLIERYPVGLQRWIDYSLTAADASWRESGRLPSATFDQARLEEARSSLRLVRNGWSPWPRRTPQK